MFELMLVIFLWILAIAVVIVPVLVVVDHKPKSAIGGIFQALSVMVWISFWIAANITYWS